MFKRLFLCCCILLGLSARAETSYEVVGGALTYHLIDGGVSQNYTQKITPDGRGIYNPLYGVRYMEQDSKEYWTVTAFGGSNSVGFPMYGALWSLGNVVRPWVYAGVVIGGYVQADGPFRDLGIQPFTISKIGDTDIVPVIGGEVNFKLMLTKRLFIKQNNLLTPVLYNTTLSLGLQF